MKLICKQCHQEFELTESEIQFFRSKGLNLPKRCQKCRQQNKEEKLNQGITVIKIEKEKPSVPVWILIAVILFFVIVIAVIFLNQKRVQKTSLLSETAVFVTETETFPETTVPPSETETENETTAPPTETETETTVPETQKPEITYVLNTYRMKFHKPNCDSVSEMNPQNRVYFYGTREEAVAQGYSPCGNCQP